MTHAMRPVRRLFLYFLLILSLAVPAQADPVATDAPKPPVRYATNPLPDALPAPTTLQRDDPWLYRGSDIPQDKGWLFGELPNGLRYAVRRNGAPPDQSSIRVRIDAGSLYESESERGFAHLLEHMTFRESKYLAEGAAISTFQRLGASFGTDTNAQTTPTQTVYQLDLPNANRVTLEETLKILSGMIREPKLSDENLALDRPIVLAELRENGGAAKRVADQTRETFYEGQPYADHDTIGTTEALNAATAASVQAFHNRWYRPENTLIVIAGDYDPQAYAALIERYFSDWKVPGESPPAPDFGQPQAPADAVPGSDVPVGTTRVMVEPDLPRAISWAILRPWKQVTDNLEYNRGLMIDTIATQVINKRLESKALAGGSFLFARVDRNKISRSADGTFITITPLTNDWKSAIEEVRAVILDALSAPPSEDEVAREVENFDIAFLNFAEQSANQAGPDLADSMVDAVDIRETVASPEAMLEIFRSFTPSITPGAVLEHSWGLFRGTVSRALYITPDGAEATPEAIKLAMTSPITADGTARLANRDIKFSDLPPIGPPADPVGRKDIGVLGIEQLDYANGVHALVWRTDNEPGRVTVQVRFGSGYRGFAPEDAPYIALGEAALVPSGEGNLGALDLEAISAGRKLQFNFTIGNGAFTFEAETRKEDVPDQLYLFAQKLADPRWDPNPVLLAKADGTLSYGSRAADPVNVIDRDLNYLVSDSDPRFKTPTPEELAGTTPEGFRAVWEPLLRQGPVEVSVFGDIDLEETIAAISRTFGALAPREPIPAEALARSIGFPAPRSQPVVEHHRGDSDQAAAVVAWPLGAGLDGQRESRRLEVLGEIFSNRLLDALREREGASYAPYVGTSWPIELTRGGRFLAIAQVTPDTVPQFFDLVDEIAADLATNGPTADEIARVTEPFKQIISRASNGHSFWLRLVDGSTTQPRVLDGIGTLVEDYTRVSQEDIRQLAEDYLVVRPAWRFAVIPEGQTLATIPPQARSAAAPATGGAVSAAALELSESGR